MNVAGHSQISLGGGSRHCDAVRSFAGSSRDSRQTFQPIKHYANSWTSSWDGVLRTAGGDDVIAKKKELGWLWTAAVELLAPCYLSIATQWKRNGLPMVAPWWRDDDDMNRLVQWSLKLRRVFLFNSASPKWLCPITFSASFIIILSPIIEVINWVISRYQWVDRSKDGELVYTENICAPHRQSKFEHTQSKCMRIFKKNGIRAWWAPYNSWRTIEECGVKIDIFSVSVRHFFGMKFLKKFLATIEEWNLAWNFCIITHFLKLIMLYEIPNLFWE